MELTQAQAAILLAIAKHIDVTGYPPTVRGIAEATGYSSPGWVHEQLDALEVKGKITRSPDRRRLIQLV